MKTNNVRLYLLCSSFINLSIPAGSIFKLKKVLLFLSRFEPRTAGWNERTEPLLAVLWAALPPNDSELWVQYQQLPSFPDYKLMLPLFQADQPRSKLTVISTEYMTQSNLVGPKLRVLRR